MHGIIEIPDVNQENIEAKQLMTIVLSAFSFEL